MFVMLSEDEKDYVNAKWKFPFFWSAASGFGSVILGLVN